MNTVEWYEHHGAQVAVRKGMKGKHREHCLCHICSLFNPRNRALNCEMANLLYDFDILLGLVTPVWECPMFTEKEELNAEVDTGGSLPPRGAGGGGVD